ncbi:MAG: CvpA family protein [Phycisphaeraceae bacterium]|nr:CvpA family protein [Phycisphaeraceae bacterium]
MFTVFNLMLFLIVLLIAYWWANQGVFSALLHLLCVVAAGAIALGFWEPMATMLIRGAWYDDIAWGVSLLVLFVVSLFVLRVTFDKVAPNNVRFPHWANLVFGGSLGFVAGVVTIGIFVIGAGFIHSHRQIMGFNGWQRDINSGQIVEVNSLWIPYHRIADSLYSSLSVGAFSTRRPLRTWYPQLYRQATLIRDSAGAGTGRTSLNPRGVILGEVHRIEGGAGRDRVVVRVDFNREAFDGRAMQLSLTSSQVRLIGRAQGKAEAEVVHPTEFAQNHGTWNRYRFDGSQSMITSRSGQERLECYLAFDVRDSFQPAFIQIRGTRLRLPAESEPPLMVAGLMRAQTADEIATTVRYGAGVRIDTAIRIEARLRTQTDLNQFPGGLSHIDRKVSGGKGIISRRSGGIPPASLRVDSFYEPPGARVVQIDVTPPFPLFGMMPLVPFGSAIAIFDVEGNRYTPVGYQLERGDGTVEVEIDTAERLVTIERFPNISGAGGQRLYMIFHVTEGMTITGMKYGELTVGECNVVVPTRGRN